MEAENIVLVKCNGRYGNCKNNAQLDGLCFFCATHGNERPGQEAFVLLRRWLDICDAIIANPPAGLNPTVFGYLEKDTKELLSRFRGFDRDGETMTNAESCRKKYQAARAEGLCGRCRKFESTNGGALCDG